MARSAAVLPVELLLHALVLLAHPPYLISVATLAAGSTLLAVWVVEPAAMRVLRGWLHAPAHARHDRLHAADALWRVRATVPDRPGVLEQLASGFAGRELNVLGVHVHTLGDEVLDEFVLAAPQEVGAEAIAGIVERAGGHGVQVRRTTATALADGQTRALTLAGRVHRCPAALPSALGELLGARVAVPHGAGAGAAGLDEATLEIGLPDGGAVLLHRPGEPFTPAERARAARLAELAGGVAAASGMIDAPDRGVAPCPSPGHRWTSSAS
jgi:hypothetical protein